MSYIEFNKEQLINLEFSLNREFIQTCKTGTYTSSTIIGCNTRKYHGLLVCPMEEIDNDNHVMLSGLDATIINDSNFNLAVRKYPGGTYEPKGHKYIEELSTEPVPKLTYRIGDIVLQMETILSEDDRILIKYTLLESNSQILLQFRPFLAFRNVHKLSKANFNVNTKYQDIDNGIKVKMYDDYKNLFLQFNKKIEYTHVPDWYYNVEYQQEQERGYEYQEDLYVPGYFELKLDKGESVIFTASLNEIKPDVIEDLFYTEIEKHAPCNNYIDCLRNSAQQFIYCKGNKTEIIAGYPWFGRWGRDTFIALPGITLYNNDVNNCKKVLDTMTSELKDGLFPNIGSGEEIALNSVDASLWFFWSLQEYSKFINNKKSIWADYGDKIKNILENYRNGTHYNIKMHDNGLIWAGEEGIALTWMDAVIAGKPVTPRIGFAVEINALWYNAVMFSLELADLANDTDFIKKWKDIPELTKKSFLEYFWIEEKRCLADYATYDYIDCIVRPNQIFACSLQYSMLNDLTKSYVVEKVEKFLLTKKGLRTLSPDNFNYKGIYFGSQEERDFAYHQGTVWPWLLGHFCEAYLKVHGKNGIDFVENIFYSFEEDMFTYGIATIPEIYDGDPPHAPKGAISQAWSVGELLRMHCLIQQYKNLEDKL